MTTELDNLALPLLVLTNMNLQTARGNTLPFIIRCILKCKSNNADLSRTIDIFIHLINLSHEYHIIDNILSPFST